MSRIPRSEITLKEMRESGPTRLIVFCGDYKCGTFGDRCGPLG